MPLVDVTYKPGYQLATIDGSKPCLDTKKIIFCDFGANIPALLVNHKDSLGLGEKTPEDGVQVQMHEYGQYDINIAEVWVKIHFSEEMPNLEERERIRNNVYMFLACWFGDAGYILPNDFVVDVIWGPTNGCGHVNGTTIEW